MQRTVVLGTCLALCLTSYVAAQGQDGARPSAFAYPRGLSMPANRLFDRLGYYPSYCVPMTSDTTYDLAFACFIRGMYNDAIVFAMHQGYQFLFITANEGIDPPVYHYLEEGGKFEKKADTLSEFLFNVAQDEW